MEIGDIGGKFESFGWNVKEVRGHNMTELVEALKWTETNELGPSAIIANTTKGKGVSFMEDNPDFHGKAPNNEELEIALEELS